MPIGPVDDSGTELYYEDSGVPPGSEDFTTLFVFHGAAFTLHTFLKLLPLASGSNVRLVVVNRRDYAGSTRYADSELHALADGKRVFMERTASELAYFLAWYCGRHKVTKIGLETKDGRAHTKGGIAVMGWGMGVASVLSVLAYPEAVGMDVYEGLGAYLRKIILYDPSHLALGYRHPIGRYPNPITEPHTDIPQELLQNFTFWVSGYYEHKLDTRILKHLDFASRGESASVENMTIEEMHVNCDCVAADRTEVAMHTPVMQPVLQDQAHRALFDERFAKEILPHLEVAYIFCTKTNWQSAWAFIETERLHKEAVEHRKEVRPMRFVEIIGGNHFAHWDVPEGFWLATIDALSI